MHENRTQSAETATEPTTKHAVFVSMTQQELKEAREKLGRNQAEMAAELGTPYRTYQDWERGKARIPGTCAVAMRLLLEKDQWVMATTLAKVGRSFDQRQGRVMERFLRRQAT
jgi:DNA-binding transcriptional regulator YiaG